MREGDYLFLYDVQDHTRTKIAELDYNFNGIWGEKYRSFSSTGNHSLLIQFLTDDIGNSEGFSALIHYIPSSANCADFLHETELILTQAIDCNWIITAPSVTSTIIIQFQYFEVQLVSTQAQCSAVVIRPRFYCLNIIVV